MPHTCFSTKGVSEYCFLIAGCIRYFVAQLIFSAALAALLFFESPIKTPLFCHRHTR